MSRLLPFDLPGLKPPGPDFEAAAEGLPSAVQALYRQALYSGYFSLPVGVGGASPRLAFFVPGHPWGVDDETLRRDTQDQRIGSEQYGPRRHHQVMVVGKHPADNELAMMLNFVGKSGEEFLRCLDEAHVSGFHDFYVTNLIKFKPPTAGGRIMSGWLKDCMPLLQQEIGLVRPEVVLLLGLDASKAVLNKSVGSMLGQALDYQYTTVEDGEVVTATTKIVALTHPAAVARDESKRRQLVNGISLFERVRQGQPAFTVETDLDHRVVRNASELRAAIADAQSRVQRRLVAMDAEWLGSRPQNPSEPKHGLRMIQFSIGPKHAVCVILRDSEGAVCFTDDDGNPSVSAAIRELEAFLKDKRIIGHHFVSDLEWLCDEGLDLRKQYSVTLFDDLDGTPAWLRTQNEGGADTGSMAHAVEETAEFGLDALSLRYTDCPPYWVALMEWLKAARKKAKESGEEFEGFGDVPEELLIPYACYDPDATFRLFLALEPMLDSDYQGNSCREAFWETMIATPAVLEMHQTGISPDIDRVNEMTGAFLTARTRQEDRVRCDANWPTLNLRSVPQVKELLFGEQYNKKFDENGRPISVRPREGFKYLDAQGIERTLVGDANVIGVTPVMTTTKPSKAWSEIVADGKESDFEPSTGKQALAVIAQDYAHDKRMVDRVLGIKNHRHIDTILKSFLRPPDLDAKNGGWVWDDESEQFVYSKGLMSFRCDDGRIRTHFSQWKETSRWSSSKPPLQNVGKRADAELAKIFASLDVAYDHPLRSIFIAPPGNVLIDVDFIGAELYGVAIMSGDQAMIEHCLRNQLAEDHANYYDLHSHAAVEMFKLDLPPLKSALKRAKKAHLRDAAKTIEFGVNYGRGARAIVIACKEMGTEISLAEAEAAIAAWFARYPRLGPFFEECRARATGPRWLSSCFGRKRRFPSTKDPILRGEFERQAMNFPIQAMIAEAMSRAIAYLLWLRDDYYKCPEMFRFVLQVHDSLVLQVPHKYAVFVKDVLLPFAMSRCVPIYRTDLEGRPTGEGPYYLGVESSIYQRWGDDSEAAVAAVEKGMAAVRNKYPSAYWLDRLGALPSLSA